ncbi:MAG: phosphatidate cytidylyltransferase [Bdellovibrionales bacterium]|nr:phosphatidate cytidylyltransferase [Bdellovibrionales bacterium]
MSSNFMGLKTRILSALVAAGSFVAIGFYGGPPGIAVVSVGIVMLGCYEFTQIGFPADEKLPPFLKVLFLGSCFAFISAALLLEPVISLATLALTSMIFFSCLLSALHKTVPLEMIRKLSSSLILGLVYTGLLPIFALKLLFLPYGLKWFSLMLIVVFSGDTFAYFVGLCFGKRKLMSSVSPKKTVAGAWGGLMGSGLVAWLAGVYLVDKHALVLFITGSIASSFFAQFGDLFESLLKRVSGHKDSGSIMPGHGGVLDRLDGIYFASPIFFLVAQYLS